MNWYNQKVDELGMAPPVPTEQEIREALAREDPDGGSNGEGTNSANSLSSLLQHTQQHQHRPGWSFPSFQFPSLSSPKIGGWMRNVRPNPKPLLPMNMKPKFGAPFL